jgi:hypothetical protein
MVEAHAERGQRKQTKKQPMSNQNAKNKSTQKQNESMIKAQ